MRTYYGRDMKTGKMQGNQIKEFKGCHFIRNNESLCGAQCKGQVMTKGIKKDKNE